MDITLATLEQLAKESFLDIIEFSHYPTPYKLRFTLIDDSYIDIYLSLSVKYIFAFHWERRHINQMIFRFDNYPHKQWLKVTSFPYHFHYQTERNVVTTPFRKEPQAGLIDFLEFARTYIVKHR